MENTVTNQPTFGNNPIGSPPPYSQHQNEETTAMEFVIRPSLRLDILTDMDCFFIKPDGLNVRFATDKENRPLFSSSAQLIVKTVFFVDNDGVRFMESEFDHAGIKVMSGGITVGMLPFLRNPVIKMTSLRVASLLGLGSVNFEAKDEVTRSGCCSTTYSVSKYKITQNGEECGEFNNNWEGTRRCMVKFTQALDVKVKALIVAAAHILYNVLATMRMQGNLSN